MPNVPTASCARVSWPLLSEGRTTGYSLIISVTRVEFLSLQKREVGDEFPVLIKALPGMRVECTARITGNKASLTSSERVYSAELSRYANGHQLVLARLIAEQDDQMCAPTYFVPTRYPRHPGDMVVRT